VCCDFETSVLLLLLLLWLLPAVHIMDADPPAYDPKSPKRQAINYFDLAAVTLARCELCKVSVTASPRLSKHATDIESCYVFFVILRLTVWYNTQSTTGHPMA
jgi:hypothetical protein